MVAFSKIYTLDEQMIRYAFDKPFFGIIQCEVKKYECCVCLEDKIHYPQQNRSVKCWTCKNLTCADCCEKIQDHSAVMLSLPHSQMSKMDFKCPCCRGEFTDAYNTDITDIIEPLRETLLFINQNPKMKKLSREDFKWKFAQLVHDEEFLRAWFRMALGAGTERFHGADEFYLNSAITIIESEVEDGTLY